MKPLGMTSDLKLTIPSSAEDAIWRAVEEAQCHGWTPEQFKKEAANAWRELLHKDADYAAKIISS